LASRFVSKSPVLSELVSKLAYVGRRLPGAVSALVNGPGLVFSVGFQPSVLLKLSDESGVAWS